MALFIMIFRRMAQNKWLVSSLFLGLLVTVALVSTMPIYSEGILSRMLVKDLEASQTESGVYPGTLWAPITINSQDNGKREQTIDDLDGYMNRAAEGFGIPVKEIVREKHTDSMRVRFEDASRNTSRFLTSTMLWSFSGLENHIALSDGRMPADRIVDGVYEALVTERALANYNMVLGTVMILEDPNTKGTVKIKPVGVIKKKADDDPYFRDPSLNELGSVFIINEKLFDSEFIQQAKAPVWMVGWFYIMDYTKLEVRRAQSYLDSVQRIQEKVSAAMAPYPAQIQAPAQSTIESYFDRARKLRLLMWSLNVPVLAMLGFYMFMVSNLIVDRQKNEIAVLRSRGAARWQIVISFAIESLLLCVIALALGPPAGMKLTEALGAANGFLEFVQRASLPVRLNPDAYRYGALAAAAAFVMTLVPVILATRVSIVGLKQQLARLGRKPLWQVAYLDVLLLAVSIYGWYTFKNKLGAIRQLGLGADDLSIDPLQFALPALFVLGVGLLLLRLYPYALRFLYYAGRKWWNPSLYAALIQVGRSGSRYQFLMVFLIMTTAIGVFSAGAARTLNSNTEDRIRYGNGAEFVMRSEWPSDETQSTQTGADSANQENSLLRAPVHYMEPPFEPYTQLPGVESATKVFVKRDASFTAGSSGGDATLIGIDTDDFGRTAWMPDHLLNYPFYDYLNLIASDSRAVLISRTLATQQKIKEGDTIFAGWGNVDKQPFTVYGIIDYFPTFNPNPSAGPADAAGTAPMLIVGHLSRIQLTLGLEPYQVWLKLKPGASTEALYKGIQESKLNVTDIVNTRSDLAKAKNDPFLMALNGLLTLGFLISILVSFIGFLLYWILSLKGRTLQNGVLRAIGVSLRQLVAMLALEQLLTTGAAILIGVLAGQFACRLYVSNFQIAFNPGSLVPPFRVVFDSADFIKLYSAIAFMLLVGMGILAYMLSRIRIHQVLKLGED